MPIISPSPEYLQSKQIVQGVTATAAGVATAEMWTVTPCED